MKEYDEKFHFDFPRIPENEHLFESRINWEEEEKKLVEQEMEKSKKHKNK